MEFVHAFNGFRGIAFINVLIDHYTYVNCILDIGQFGVAMFYVLSAYLLTGQLYKQYLEKNQINICNYWIRRFFRIYPCLMLALFCEYLTGRLTNYQIWNIFCLTGIVGFYWAIYVEMRFYIIVPLIVVIFAKIRNFILKFSLMLALFLLGFFYHFYLNFMVDEPRGFRRWDIDDYSFEKNIVFINYIPIFLVGSFMSIIVYHLKKFKHNFNSFPILKGLFILFISLIHGPIIYYRCMHGINTFWGLPFSNFNFIFCTGYVIALMFMNGKNFMTSFYQSKIISFFGDISYPAYLFHTIVREFTFKYWGWNSGQGFHLFLCFLITVALSYLIHITVENYFIKKTKFWCIKQITTPKEEVLTPREENMYKNLHINNPKSINTPNAENLYKKPIGDDKNDLEISLGLIENKF